MNIIHMKYAIEVAKAGSINKASEVLLTAQPNLSRAIKELEAELGITIFTRSSRGMGLTPEGEEFIGYAKNIMRQLDEIELLYKKGMPVKQSFSISVPRASYISDAFAKFSNHIGASPAEIFYMETNSDRIIKNILEQDYKLGIIRYAEQYDKYFKDLLDEKGLQYELVAEFSYVLVMSREHPLAKKDRVKIEDLRPYIEIAHADPYVPSLPLSTVRKEERKSDCDRHIYVFERGGQFSLLSNNSDTFMWVSPLPAEILERFDLVQKECRDNTKRYRDLLIYKKNYALTELDKQFISELKRSKAGVIKG